MTDDDAGLMAALDTAPPLDLLRRVHDMRAGPLRADANRFLKELARHFKAFSSSAVSAHGFLLSEFSRVRRRAGMARAYTHLRRVLTAIRVARYTAKCAGLEESPWLELTQEDCPPGTRRIVNGSPFAAGEALHLADGLRIASHLQFDDRIAIRDRALLALGVIGGMGRMELAALTWREVGVWPDQVRIGRRVLKPSSVHLSLCPVASLSTLQMQVRHTLHLPSVPVFRCMSSDAELLGAMGPDDVDAVVQFRASMSGLGLRLSPDSMRVGHTLWLVESGVPSFDVIAWLTGGLPGPTPIGAAVY